MYKCNNCNATFERFDVVDDNGEKWHVCPYCKKTEFDEAKEICELCGDYYLESRHTGVCESCINIIAARFQELFHEKFTPFERSIINSVYEGRNLE